MIYFRKAEEVDLPAIIELLADDKLGRHREIVSYPLPDVYYKAFKTIHEDDNQELIVAIDDSGNVAGTLQLTFIQGLTYQGGIRAQIEAVRVKEGMRGYGIGERMIRHAIERAKERKAHMVQLTSDKQRPDAIRFYERLRFKCSHEGLKMHLPI